MKMKLLVLLMMVSASAYAERAAVENEEWVGATKQVVEEQQASKQKAHNETAQLELSQPWHYGRQDSDAVVNREYEHWSDNP